MAGAGARGHASAQMVVIRAGETPPVAPQEPPRRHLQVMGVHQPIELRNPVDGRYEEFARANLAIQQAHGLPMVQTKTVALCGAGPSLRHPKAAAKIAQADAVWACNSALPWMVAQGIHVDVGIGMDQTPALLREWSDPPDVTYYVASTCDPELVRHLLDHGRRVQFFHNAVGFDGEMEHYRQWPPSAVAHKGSTVVSRSIWLAQWQGFHCVDLYGVDCAFQGDTVHANGENYREAYGNPLLLTAEIDGVRWITRPDMLMDAVDLVRYARQQNGLIRFQAGTLPAALWDKDDAFLDSVSRRLQPGELPPEPGA